MNNPRHPRGFLMRNIRMLSNINFMDYFRAVANSAKFQISAAVSFGAALILTWYLPEDFIKITLTLLFLFPVCMFTITLCEKLWYFFYQKYKTHKEWNNLTQAEDEFIDYYIKHKTKTRYMVIYNGTYRDSGVINLLLKKKILYLASNVSEYRGDSIYDMEQYMPFNINDKAYEHFMRRNS